MLLFHDFFIFYSKNQSSKNSIVRHGENSLRPLAMKHVMDCGKIICWISLINSHVIEFQAIWCSSQPSECFTRMTPTQMINCSFFYFGGFSCLHFPLVIRFYSSSLISRFISEIIANFGTWLNNEVKLKRSRRTKPKKF